MMRPVDETLFKAIINQDEGRVLELLKNGANPNQPWKRDPNWSWNAEPSNALTNLIKDDEYPLHIAIRYGRSPSSLRIINILLDSEVNLLSGNRSEENAVHYATRYNQPECLKLLVEKNVPLNEMDVGGNTALMNAVYGDDQLSLEVLIQEGAALDAANQDGYTALHLAVKNQNVLIIQCLLAAGANRWARAQGKTAKEWAAFWWGELSEEYQIFIALEEQDTLSEALKLASLAQKKVEDSIKPKADLQSSGGSKRL